MQFYRNCDEKAKDKNLDNNPEVENLSSLKNNIILLEWVNLAKI